MASQCWQGATFSQAVVAPDVGGSGILRVPGAMSLPACVAACCDLPGYDLAWLFEGRCYILSCHQGASCRPRERAGADSVLVFLRRASQQTLILQSLVRGEPYGGRWRPSSPILEDPGNLESLRDLALLQQDPPEPRTQDYLEGSPEETAQGPEATGQPSAGGRSNQSEEGEGPGQGRTGSDVDQSRATSTSQGAEGGTRGPAEPDTHRLVSGEPQSTQEAEPHPSFCGFTFRLQTESPSGADSTPQPRTTDSSHPDVATSLPASARPVSTTGVAVTLTPPPADQPLMLSSGNPVDHRQSSEPTTGTALARSLTHSHTHTRLIWFLMLLRLVEGSPACGRSSTSVHASSSRGPDLCPHRSSTHKPAHLQHHGSCGWSVGSFLSSRSCFHLHPVVEHLCSEVRGSNRGPVAIVGPDRKLSLPVGSLLLDGRGSIDDRGIVSYRWDSVR